MMRLIVVLLAMAGLALGQGKTPIKFTLDFAFQGPQGPFLLAQDKGYYDKEGLAVTIDRGFGSADAISKIASGAYDMGFGDINSMMEFNARNPGKGLISVFIVYDAAPFSIFTLKKSGINSPKDLEGKTLAAPAGDAGRRLFPVFAEAAGIDAGKVTFINVDAALREPTLARGQADGITGFYFTSLLNLRAINVPEADLKVFRYSDYTKFLYGNAVIVRPDFAAKNPEAVRAFLRALVKGFRDTFANPDEAVEAVRKRDGLINVALEKDRLVLAIRNSIITPDTQAFGIGTTVRDRLVRSIELVKRAFDLPVLLKPEQVFTDRYLPPLAERRAPQFR
jgi:NitT/TauT family transport system substrate-binding protein